MPTTKTLLGVTCPDIRWSVYFHRMEQDRSNHPGRETWHKSAKLRLGAASSAVAAPTLRPVTT